MTNDLHARTVEALRSAQGYLVSFDECPNLVADINGILAEHEDVGQLYADATNDLACLGDFILHGIVREPDGEYAKKVFAALTAAQAGRQEAAAWILQNGCGTAK